MQRTQALRERTSALRTARTRRLRLSFALSTVTPLSLRAAHGSTPRILTTRRPLLRCALGLAPCSTRPLLRSSARASHKARLYVDLNGFKLALAFFESNIAHL